MNDPFGRISSPAPAGNAGSRGGLAVQILTLPSQLNNNSKTLRLDGQITQLNKSGSVTIATPVGDIEVKIKGNRQPQQGQKIEIEVPAGRPPRQATLREPPAQQNSARQPSTHSAKVTLPNTPSLPNTVITDPRITSPVPPPTEQVRTTPPPTNITPQEIPTAQTTPVKPNTPQPLPPVLQETVAPATNNSKPLVPDSTVRLLAVPPAQAQSVATEYLQTLPQPQSTIIERAAFSANLIAQNAKEDLTKPLVQIPQNLVPQTTKPLTNILQDIAQPFQTLAKNNPAPSQNAPIISIQPSVANAIPATSIAAPVLAQAIPASLTLPPENAVPILPTVKDQVTAPQISSVGINKPIDTSLTPLPINFDPTTSSNLVAPRINKIDIQIVQIIPAKPNLLPPVTGQTANNQPPLTIPAATKFAPPLISNNNAATITAQVTGFTQGGLPLVTARFPGSPLPQSFILQYNSNNLQLGTQLQIIPKTAATPVTPIITAPSQGALTTLLQGFQWPALDELYNNLLQISPQAAASLAKSLPNAGSPNQISAAAMMFIAAVKSGDLGGFLGDRKIDLLQRAGKSDILSRLTQTSTSTARTNAPEQAGGGEWRAVPLPMFWENEIHRITLYTRQDQQNNQHNDQKGNGQTRFIFDLTLSRIGDVQLDGLLRDKRLDLVLRTQNTFSEPMQQTMRQAYSSALTHADLSGDITFQGSTKNWVHVLEQKEQLGVHV
ncbi:MAG TPA: hypothetical protein PLF01_05725 [Alphaproteobacteria bacterium]|nr:hypothetical protein [Alphaproteobacteria bacterium]